MEPCGRITWFTDGHCKVWSVLFDIQNKPEFTDVPVVYSVNNRPYGYSVTTHHYYGAVGTHPSGMLSFC